MWDGYLREETGKSWGKWAEPKKLCLDTQALCAGPGLWSLADPTTSGTTLSGSRPGGDELKLFSGALIYSFPGKLSGKVISLAESQAQESPWAAEELPPSLDVREESRALFSSIVYQGSPRDRKGLEVLDRQNYKPSLRVPTWVVVTMK